MSQLELEHPSSSHFLFTSITRSVIAFSLLLQPLSVTFSSDLLETSHLLLCLHVSFPLASSSLAATTPVAPFCHFRPLSFSSTLVTPKYSCHLSVSSPFLLSTFKSFSISLPPPSYSFSPKAMKTPGCHFTSAHTFPLPHQPRCLLSVYLVT